jgi:hemoglobin-like flavoprotein
MGEALIFTLELILKGDFTNLVREAWVETYTALAQDMVRALNAKKTKEV